MEKGFKNFFSCLPFDPDQTHPLLLISHGMNQEIHTFCDVSKNEYIERNIPEFNNKQVCYASYGWLVLIDISTRPLHCYLVKASSAERIQLPPIELELDSTTSYFYQCILSKPPSDPDCHVLLISPDNYIHFCRIGDKKFIKRTNKFGDIYFFTGINFEGKIYAWMISVSHFNYFVEVDFLGENLILNQIVNDKGQPCQVAWPPSKSPWFKAYLVESCGELLLVHKICYHHSAEAAYFRIFKIKPLESKTEELRSIGDRTIFLCSSGGVSSINMHKKLDCCLKKNSIYYISYDGNLCTYDIEDRSKTQIKLCPIKGGTRTSKSWIMPYIKS